MLLHLKLTNEWAKHDRCQTSCNMVDCRHSTCLHRCCPKTIRRPQTGDEKGVHSGTTVVAAARRGPEDGGVGALHGVKQARLHIPWLEWVVLRYLHDLPPSQWDRRITAGRLRGLLGSVEFIAQQVAITPALDLFFYHALPVATWSVRQARSPRSLWSTDSYLLMIMIWASSANEGCALLIQVRLGEKLSLSGNRIVQMKSFLDMPVLEVLIDGYHLSFNTKYMQIFYPKIFYPIKYIIKKNR